MNKEPDNWYESLTIKEIEKMMEEIAGDAQRGRGQRQPGEKCMYEQYNKEGEKLNG